MSEYVCSNRFKITKYRDGEDKTVKFVDCGDVYETDTICDETRGGWIFLKSKRGMPEIGVKPNDFKKNFTKNPMGKPIEKHYCTKCVHGILCESGELKCNHEAWTTTKDGTYAYPNGLRQIKSRDKPSWCPGFKAMQEREILKMAENKTVTYADGVVIVESGAIDECPDVYHFPPSVDMENVLGLVDALGLNFNLGVAVQHIAYAEDSTSNDVRIRNLCQARGYIEREIKAVSEK